MVRSLSGKAKPNKSVGQIGKGGHNLSLGELLLLDGINGETVLGNESEVLVSIGEPGDELIHFTRVVQVPGNIVDKPS